MKTNEFITAPRELLGRGAYPSDHWHWLCHFFIQFAKYVSAPLCLPLGDLWPRSVGETELTHFISRGWPGAAGLLFELL